MNTLPNPIPRSFFARPTLLVARELLGARLVRLLDGRRLEGIINETEAYIGEEDRGCHAAAGRTKRTEVMYGRPGTAYVYFTYGMHWLLNAVTERVDFPAAVLIRSVQPTDGLEVIAGRRAGRPRKDWTNGPAKLTLALGVDGSLNGSDLCDLSDGLWIEPGDPFPDDSVTTGPRVGLYTVPEPWKSIPWRFLAQLPPE